jgi:hypothetical protein
VSWHIYRFENDDDSRWSPLSQFDGNIDVEKLKTVLRAAGWEGDGDLTFAFMPPWLNTVGDTFWFPVFHVKQQNHGVSFIAAESEIKFAENFNWVATRN